VRKALRKAHGLIRDVYPHARSFWVSVKKMWYAASLPKPMAVLLYTEIMVKTTPGVGWSTRGAGEGADKLRRRRLGDVTALGDVTHSCMTP